MHRVILILLIFIFLVGCGKKSNPKYEGIKIQKNNIINLLI